MSDDNETGEFRRHSPTIGNNLPPESQQISDSSLVGFKCTLKMHLFTLSNSSNPRQVLL